MRERGLLRAVSSPERFIFLHAKRGNQQKKIGVLALGAARAFSMVAGVRAQGGGAGGGAGGAGGAGAVAGGSAGSSVGGRGVPNAPSSN
jgi:hypothetical protein